MQNHIQNYFFPIVAKCMRKRKQWQTEINANFSQGMFLGANSEILLAVTVITIKENVLKVKKCNNVEGKVKQQNCDRDRKQKHMGHHSTLWLKE